MLLISGTLFVLAWNPFVKAFSLFFAFIPLLFLFENKQLAGSKVFNLSFFAFILFHLGTVWWLSNSSFPGFLIIISLNSLVMASVIWLSFLTYKQFGNSVGLISFVIYWLSFEYIHYRWELSWPFMNLGNWLGQTTEIIQWYEYTGVLGGTLWILLVNVSMFLFVKLLINKKIKLSIVSFFISIVIFLVPIILSKRICNSYIENGTEVKMKIIQPNINPYKEKYNSKLFKQQIGNQIELAKQNDTSQIDCYLFPESSFPVYLNEDSINTEKLIQQLDSQLISNRKTSVLGGLYSFRIVNKDTLFYNTAFMLNSNIETYHKSKLVIGVEKMPFQDYLQFLKKWNLDFGGYSSSLTTDDKRKVFYSSDSSLQIAPIICFESVYGQFVSEFIKSGATCIVVITNDGWWGDTPGYKQHLMHSQLRAIETRKSVARSANTGVSCFINQTGQIVKQSKAWDANYLTASLLANHTLTFYTRNGDFIGKIALSSSLLILIYSLYLYLANRTKKP